MEAQDIISSGLLELYATGLSSDAETLQVQEWLLQYPELRTELNNIESCMETYAMMNAVQPGTGNKKAIFEKINGTNPVKTALPASAKVISISPAWKYAAAASIILLLASGILNFIYYGKYQKANVAYEQKNEELLAVNESMKLMNEDMSVVKNKYSQPVSLNGLPAAPDAAAKIFWMKNTGEVYIDPSNLPDAPNGMQYQLWGIVAGKPVDAGLIITTKSGSKYHIQKMKSFSNVKVDAFAVTLETSGGNPVPKGEMYVMGEM